MSDRPNLLVVMAESFGLNECPGFASDVLQMPNLKALMDESISFEGCYTPAPVCGPARAAFLTGCQVYNTETYDNGSTIPPWLPTFAHVLTAAGYETALCGRMHIHGLDQNKGFERRLASEIIDPRLGTQADWPGKLIPLSDPGPAKTWPETYVVSDSPLYKHDEYVTKQASAYMRKRGAADDGKPFIMTVGYLAAHPAGNGTPGYKKWFDHYMELDDLPVVTFTRQDYAALPDHAKRRLLYAKVGEEVFDPEYHRFLTALFYARCSYLDEQLGQLLSALKESGLADNTYLFFTADHGENAGHKGVWGKMVFDEASVRVPMVVRTPGGRAGGSVKEGRISLIDVLPTLAELGGGQVDFPVDGVSFAKVLTGTEDDAPRGPHGSILSEYHGYLSPSGMYMLVRDRFKYCRYLEEPDELYDFITDPEEEDELFTGGTHLAIRTQMQVELDRLVDIGAVERQIAIYNQRRQAVFDGLSSSAIIQRDSDAFVQHFREQHDEEWWDGGEFMANEKKLLSSFGTMESDKGGSSSDAN